MSTSVFWTETTIELPGVREGGMSGRNGQRKPGTTRGSLRRSRTAKASRISRHAVKSRCAREWDGWGRISDEQAQSYANQLTPRPPLVIVTNGHETRIYDANTGQAWSGEDDAAKAVTRLLCKRRQGGGLRHALGDRGPYGPRDRGMDGHRAD